MTDDPPLGPTPGPPSGSQPLPGSSPPDAASPLPPESRAARSLTDRSIPEDPPPIEPLPEPYPRPRTWPRIVGVLILLVVAAGVFAWQEPDAVRSSLRWLFPGLTGNGDAARVAALEARVTRLEDRQPPDLGPLTQRVDALEHHLPPNLPSSGQAEQQQEATELRALRTRLAALEAHAATVPAGPAGPGGAPPSTANGATLVPVGPDMGPLFARLDALEKKVDQPTIDPAKVDARLAALEKQADRPTVEPARVDALAARVADLSASDSGDVHKLDDVEHRLGDLAANETKVAQTSDRAARLARMEIALAAGKPLGVLPDVPPALAHFAAVAPPTESGLRLSFTTASQAALKVSQPDTAGKPFLDRVLARLQDFRLITVREGDRVVIGNSTAAVLARARVLLDAGDLEGTVREVASLTGPPAEKMAPWLADAKALLAAREALASLAEPG